MAAMDDLTESSFWDKCMYPYCRSKICNKKLTFYGFPCNNDDMVKKWLEALNLSNYTPRYTDFICSKHFDPDCIDNGVLHPTAVPHKFTPLVKSILETWALKRRYKQQKQNITYYSLGEKKCCTCNFGKSLIDHISEFDICRLCGRAKDTLMTDIFDEELDICEKISLCLPIIVSPNDSLPQSICDECLCQLNAAVDLIKMCVATEKEFTGNETPKEEPMEIEPLPIDGPITCDKCGAYFNDMTLFDEHIVENHEEDAITLDIPVDPFIVCSTCGHVYHNQAVYDEHKLSGSYLCDLCDGKFESICSVNMHKRLKFRCQQCGIVLPSELILNLHILFYHGEDEGLQKVEKVDIPVIDPTSVALAVKPMNTKISTWPLKEEFYHCRTCDVVLDSIKKLREHFRECHGTSKISWICGVCGKGLATKYTLKSHVRIHFDDKPYICEMCGMTYRSRATLYQHQVVHTGIQKHVCPACGKRFSRKSYMQTHMRVHTGGGLLSAAYVE